MTKPQLYETLPQFSLVGTDGKMYTQADFLDKEILIIIFSCNHCPYVQAYEERIIKLQEKYQSQGVQIIAINSNDAETYPEDSFENMKLRGKEKGYNFPYLHDAAQKSARDFGASHTPELFVYDEKRRLVYMGKIDDNWREPERVQTLYLEEAIDELLAGKEVSVPETYAVGCTIKWKVK